MLRAKTAGKIFEETAAHSVGETIRNNPRFATHRRPVVINAALQDCTTICRPSDVLFTACNTYKIDDFMNALDRFDAFDSLQGSESLAQRPRVLVIGTEFGSFLGIMLVALGFDVKVVDLRSIEDLYLPRTVLLHRVHQETYDTFLSPFVAHAWEERLHWFRGGVLHANLFQAAAMKTADAMGVHFSFDYKPDDVTKYDHVIDFQCTLSGSAEVNALVVYLNDEVDMVEQIARLKSRKFDFDMIIDGARLTGVQMEGWTERDGCLTPHMRIVQMVFDVILMPNSSSENHIEKAVLLKTTALDASFRAFRQHVDRHCNRNDFALVDFRELTAFHRPSDINLERCLERLHQVVGVNDIEQLNRLPIDENITLFHDGTPYLTKNSIVRVGTRYFKNRARFTENVKLYLEALQPHYLHSPKKFEVQDIGKDILAATPCFQSCVLIVERMSSSLNLNSSRCESKTLETDAASLHRQAEDALQERDYELSLTLFLEAYRAESDNFRYAFDAADMLFRMRYFTDAHRIFESIGAHSNVTQGQKKELQTRRRHLAKRERLRSKKSAISLAESLETYISTNCTPEIGASDCPLKQRQLEAILRQ